MLVDEKKKAFIQFYMYRYVIQTKQICLGLIYIFGEYL